MAPPWPLKGVWSRAPKSAVTGRRALMAVPHVPLAAVPPAPPAAQFPSRISLPSGPGRPRPRRRPAVCGPRVLTSGAWPGPVMNPGSQYQRLSPSHESESVPTRGALAPGRGTGRSGGRRPAALTVIMTQLITRMPVRPNPVLDS